jgi:type II secretory pathway pseudopilin PulG
MRLSPCASGRRSPEAGFALVEVLVAAVILAGVTAMYMRSAASSAGAAHAIEVRRSAILVARSALEQASIENSGLPLRGRQGGYDWQVSILPEPGSDSSALRLERVIVRVSAADGDTPLVTLTTLRIVR